MEYDKTSDLPEPVQEHLSEHAQEIYMQAFNSAWREYADPSRRRVDESREQTAHKVAWSAVEDEYAKGADGNWYQR